MENITTNNRIDKLDICKGIIIILVVVYHALVTNIAGISINFDNWLFNTLGSFIMPAFMILSGFAIYSKIGKEQWASKKIVGLIYPVIIWTFLYYAIAQVPILSSNIKEDSLINWLVSNVKYGFNSVLWYLWTLVLCYIVFYGIES